MTIELIERMFRELQTNQHTQSVSRARLVISSNCEMSRARISAIEQVNEYVVNDVAMKLKEDPSIDSDVLQELKRLWVSRLPALAARQGAIRPLTSLPGATASTASTATT
jgi:hypothetical protein